MNNTPWTAEEQRRLLAARDLGMGYETIAKTYLPGRSPSACKYQYYALTETKGPGLGGNNRIVLQDSFASLRIEDASERLHHAWMLAVADQASALGLTFEQSFLAAHHGVDAAVRYTEKAA